MKWTLAGVRWKWALAAAALAAFTAAVGWVLAGDLNGNPGSTPELALVATRTPPPATRPAATPEPTPSLTPPQPSALPTRLLIPAIEVDAPVTVKSLRPDGVMDIPNGPEDVAWYNFTATPGTGANAVFSGHLDYRDYGPAVFWRLKDLKEDDAIEVQLDDGTVLRYRISLKTSYDARTAPVGEIVGPTTKEVLTLITCGGSFDSRSRNYSHRLVVRAERI